VEALGSTQNTWRRKRRSQAGILFDLSSASRSLSVVPWGASYARPSKRETRQAQ